MFEFLGMILLWSFAIYGFLYFVKDNFEKGWNCICKIGKRMCDFCLKFVDKKNR